MTTLVSYDISNDRRRSRLAKVLEGWGRRVQYSVFECEVALPRWGRFLDELTRNIDLQQDSLRIYHLCQPCSSHVLTLGLTPQGGAPGSVTA